MRKLIMAAMLLLLAVPAPGLAKAVKVIEPLASGLAGNVTVAGTTVVVGETARVNLAKLETKAAEKRVAAKLAPFDPAAPVSARPPAEVYETLPLTTMMPLEVEDVTREWGLVAGRAVKLTITLDTVKTANAAMALLIASSDQLAGTVAVSDAASGAKLGEFYVDVLNTHGGWLGMAVRGSGVREKLAGEFAKHIAEQLSGLKHKPKAATSAAQTASQ